MKNKGCGKIIIYMWKSPSGLYVEMPSHNCGKEGMMLYDKCLGGRK